MPVEHTHKWERRFVVEPITIHDAEDQCPDGIDVTTWNDSTYRYICGCRPEVFQYKACGCGKVLF